MMMEEERFNRIVELVLRQLQEEGLVPGAQKNRPGGLPNQAATTATGPGLALHPDMVSSALAVPEIDLPDPASDAFRWQPRVRNAKDPVALKALIASTSARIGVGRAGARSNTASLLLFQGDHAITQDALYRDVDQRLLDEFNLMTVQTRITEGKEEYLLRPDLGRQLSDAARQVLAEKCLKSPDLQLVIGDGLSALAIESNLRQIFPVIIQGAQSAGLRIGTPFHIKYCRVGVMNDIGDIIRPRVLVLLIGERPGLGRAESMSAYMAYQPGAGQNDADRDVVCNIYEKGGTNPLEAGAFIVQFAQKMMQFKASGVKLKLAAG